MPTKNHENNQDTTENRKRVATYIDGPTYSYEAALTTGTTVCDFFTDSSGRIGHKGYFINDGPGDIQVEISADGTIYGGIHTTKDGNQINLDDLSIKKIRLTYVADSAYRILLA